MPAATHLRPLFPCCTGNLNYNDNPLSVAAIKQATISLLQNYFHKLQVSNNRILHFGLLISVKNKSCKCKPKCKQGELGLYIKKTAKNVPRLAASKGFYKPEQQKSHTLVYYILNKRKRGEKKKNTRLAARASTKKRSRHPLVAKKLCSILCPIKNQRHKRKKREEPHFVFLATLLFFAFLGASFPSSTNQQWR